MQNTLNETEELEFEDVPSNVDFLFNDNSNKIEFEEEEEIKEEPIVESPTEIEFEQEEESLTVEEEETKVDLLSGVKAVLQKKLERYGIEAEVDISELDEEQLEQFEEELDQHILQSKWNNVKGTNQNIQKLLDYLEAGGEPETMVELFQKQQEIAKIDTTTEKGKVELLKDYYQNVVKWGEDKVEKKIETLLNADLIDEEVSIIEEEYNKYFEEEQDKKIKKQKEIEAQEQVQFENRKATFENKLASIPLAENIKENYKKIAFGKVVLKTGEKVDAFDFRIEQFKQNPDYYLKLVQFLSNPQQYDQIVVQNNNNATVQNQMRKGFEVPKKTKDSESQIVTEKQKIQPNINSTVKKAFNFK